MFTRVLISLVVWLLAFSAVGSPQSSDTGTLQGHLKIISTETVQLADGSIPTVTPQTYLEYPLVVLSSDSKKELETLIADAQGNFRANLPPGSYILDIQNRVRKHVRAKPVAFTVAANQTAHVNIEMDTGIR